jgi:glycosyltransferase involved in cell wall biosynthesis
VVDDGSRDDTSSQAAQAGAKVVRHVFNMGYGVALQTGYKYADQHHYDYLVQIDADGQHEVKDIETLLEEIKHSGADLVIGSRYLGGRKFKTSLARRIGTAIFRKLTVLITRQKLTDSTSGFQALNKKVIHFCAVNPFPCDYPDANVIIWLVFSGFRIKEAAVQMYERSAGKSKCVSGVFSAFYYVFKMLLSIVVLLTLKKESLSEEGGL